MREKTLDICLMKVDDVPFIYMTSRLLLYARSRREIPSVEKWIFFFLSLVSLSKEKKNVSSEYFFSRGLDEYVP